MSREQRRDLLAFCGEEQALEGTASNEWVCFENALVMNDLPSGGIQSFFSRADAHSFRKLVYANHGMPKMIADRL